MTSAPFSLSNVVTLVLAVTCTLIVMHQQRTRNLNLALTGVLGISAIMAALLLLTDNLHPTPYSDGAWLVALVLGILIGYRRARRLDVIFEPGARLKGDSKTMERVVLAGILLAAAAAELLFGLFRQFLVPAKYLATVASLCAGYHAGWCYRVIARIIALRSL